MICYFINKTEITNYASGDDKVTHLLNTLETETNLVLKCNES